MKKIFLTLAIVSTLFIGCTSDDNIEDRPIFELAEAPVITAPDAGAAYVFTLETKDLLAERFTFTDADFNFDSATIYAVQVDLEGNEFANAQELGSGNSLQIPVSVDSFNNAALALGLTPGEATNVEVRIEATVGEGTPQYSESRVVSVTPFTTEAPKLYVVGSFLEASGYGPNWTPSDTSPFISATAFGETEYEGFVFFNDASANYLFLPTNTSFDGKYGDSGASNGSYTEMLIQDGGVDCGLPSGSPAGYYFVKADLTDENDLSYSVEPAEWAIVGGATPLGWPAGGTEGQPGNDHDMTYNPDTRVWEITINLSAGEFKFRANDDWALNLGPDSDGDGFMNFGGFDNLSVDTAGTYKVTLDLSNPRAYIYTAELQ